MRFSQYLLIIYSVLFINLNIHSQSFQMQYNHVSAREVRFDVVYKGPGGEISLPPRGRIVSIAEQENINIGNGKIRVGIRIGNQDNINTEHTIRFSYSYILPNQGGYGSITERVWYPSIKNYDAEYTISDINNSTNLIIYPYLSQNNSSFTFSEEQKPKLVTIDHTIDTYSNTIQIIIYKNQEFSTPLENIEKIYNHYNNIFGKLNIKEIIIINNNIVDTASFIQDSKIYITLPGRGTPQQLMNVMISNWATLKPDLSPRLFSMFKDAILRISPPNLSSSEIISSDSNTNNTNSPFSNTEKEDEKTAPVLLEKDPSLIVLVPPKSYYETLINTGFSNNSIIDADIANIFNNYGLLHMAWYNIGLENFITGIKAYFAEQKTEISNTNITTSTNATTNQTENPTIQKNDVDLVNWNLITQNKLQEPLYSLYTKEVLNEDKLLIPHLIAKGNQATRNSYNIPDLTITQEDKTIVKINWNDFRTTTTGITNGHYTLDSERQVPQQVFLDSYYNYDTNQQQLRRRLLFASERIKGVGEQNFKKHLDIVELTATSDNKFEIKEGTKIYIIISHILSNACGSLKDAIKETIFIIDPDTNNPVHISSRIRI